MIMQLCEYFDLLRNLFVAKFIEQYNILVNFGCWIYLFSQLLFTSLMILQKNTVIMSFLHFNFINIIQYIVLSFWLLPIWKWYIVNFILNCLR